MPIHLKELYFNAQLNLAEEPNSFLKVSYHSNTDYLNHFNHLNDFFHVHVLLNFNKITIMSVIQCFYMNKFEITCI